MRVGQRVGPFEVEKQLGGGAMGSVYRARYCKTGQKVALKVMLAGLGGNETALARFEREAKVLKQLSHRNIVRFYIASQHQGTPYYAMEYVEGEPLDAALQRKGRLTWEKIVDLGKQVCAALQHAHDQGIVHRDLKPSNLMVTADGTIKLTDFGIAKDLDVTQLTSANCTVGTAAYMSPEQCRGERNLTHKSDLYSLGVVLYELLTGHKPFEAETTMDMFLQHVQGTFERPSREVLDIPVWLDTLVCQLLEKEPARRPYDAVTVLRALEQVAEKVQAQRSAGVDIAQARIADRETLRNVNLDRTDRQAARTLRANLKKEKRKRRGKPIYEKKWFQAAGLMLALIGIAAMIYQALRPPSAESLYRQAERLIAAKKWEEARDERGPINRYLYYYKNQQDEQTAQVEKWARKCDVVMMGQQLGRLMQSERSGRSGAGSLAKKAVEKEQKEDLTAAENYWEKCQTEAPAEDEHAWAVFAEEQLIQYDQARRRKTDLEQIKVALQKGDPDSARSEPREAIAAVHFELFNDPDKARQVWHAFKSRHETWYNSTDLEDNSRLWYLVAALQIADFDERLKGKKPEELNAERVTALTQGLKVLSDYLEQKPPPDANGTKIARMHLRHMVDMYEDEAEPKIKEILKKAKDLLEKSAPSEKPPDTPTTDK